jgi:cytochrome c553
MASRMKRLTILIALTWAGGVTSNAFAADAAAGKAVARAQCAECHEADDWEGEDTNSLTALIRDIVAGKAKHKRPLQLSDADIQNIAAYWAAQGGKK